MTVLDFLALTGGSLILLRVLKRLERKLCKHRASYALQPRDVEIRFVDGAEDDPELAAFLSAMFSNWTVDELARLSKTADIWMERAE